MSPSDEPAPSSPLQFEACPPGVVILLTTAPGAFRNSIWPPCGLMPWPSPTFQMPSLRIVPPAGLPPPTFQIAESSQFVVPWLSSVRKPLSVLLPPVSDIVAPGRMTVWPVPVCVPPDQVNVPVTSSVSVPPTLPPDWVSVPAVAWTSSEKEVRLKLTVPAVTSVRFGML